MVANGLLYSQDSPLRKGSICEEFRCQFGSDESVIATMTALAFLPYIVKSYCGPNSGKIAPFAGRNRICNCHHTFEVIEVMCGILAPLPEVAGAFYRDGPAMHVQ